MCFLLVLMFVAYEPTKQPRPARSLLTMSCFAFSDFFCLVISHPLRWDPGDIPPQVVDVILFVFLVEEMRALRQSEHLPISLQNLLLRDAPIDCYTTPIYAPIRYTAMVDRHMAAMAACLQDSHPLVRRHAILLISQLLLQVRCRDCSRQRNREP